MSNRNGNEVIVVVRFLEDIEKTAIIKIDNEQKDLYSKIADFVYKTCGKELLETSYFDDEGRLIVYQDEFEISFYFIERYGRCKGDNIIVLNNVLKKVYGLIKKADEERYKILEAMGKDEQYKLYKELAKQFEHIENGECHCKYCGWKK